LKECDFGYQISERIRIAKKYISEGEGEYQRIMGDKEREVRTISSGAYKEAREIEGKADAEAVGIYAQAYGKDPAFYRFTRTLQLYEESVGKGTKLVLGTAEYSKDVV
jgi:membrane protease subunit HflC